MRPYTFYLGLLCRLSVVVFQQSADPLATENPSATRGIIGRRHDSPITQLLMRAFFIIMFHELINNMAKWLFAGEYHFVRAFGFLWSGRSVPKPIVLVA